MSSPKTRLFPRASSGPLLFQVPALPGQLLRATPFLPALPSACLNASLNRASPHATILCPATLPASDAGALSASGLPQRTAHGKAVLPRKPALLKDPKNTVTFPAVVQKEPPFSSASCPDSGKRLREPFSSQGRFFFSVLPRSSAPPAPVKEQHSVDSLHAIT